MKQNILREFLSVIKSTGSVTTSAQKLTENSRDKGNVFFVYLERDITSSLLILMSLPNFVLSLVHRQRAKVRVNKTAI